MATFAELILGRGASVQQPPPPPRPTQRRTPSCPTSTTKLSQASTASWLICSTPFHSMLSTPYCFLGMPAHPSAVSSASNAGVRRNAEPRSTSRRREAPVRCQ